MGLIRPGLTLPDTVTTSNPIQGPIGQPGQGTFISPPTQGLVEYAQYAPFANPNAPSAKCYTDQWSTETLDATITPLVNPNSSYPALFDANGIILDPNTCTEVVAEINGVQQGAANGAGYKIAMSWMRNGAAAPTAMRTAQLVSDSYGTNAGAPPATWAAGLANNVAQLALVGPINGLYYCQPQVQGVALATIGWGGLFQWRKTVSS
jgi:hypothetical protein